MIIRSGQPKACENRPMRTFGQDSSGKTWLPSKPARTIGSGILPRDLGSNPAPTFLFSCSQSLDPSSISISSSNCPTRFRFYPEFAHSDPSTVSILSHSFRIFFTKGDRGIGNILSAVSIQSGKTCSRNLRRPLPGRRRRGANRKEPSVQKRQEEYGTNEREI